MKVIKIIITEIFLIFDTTRNMSLSEKNEFAGGVANWCRLGYELSVVNITTCCCLKS